MVEKTETEVFFFQIGLMINKGREAGGGTGMGNTCKSMADSCQCMAKTTTILLSN